VFGEGVSGLRGVLVDFGHTLAYIDVESDRKYKEGLLSILKKSGYQNDLENLTSAIVTFTIRAAKAKPKATVDCGNCSSHA